MLAEMLVMTKPYDHICFLKNAVQDVCRMRDNLRIVLIAPPQLGMSNCVVCVCVRACVKHIK